MAPNPFECLGTTIGQLDDVVFNEDASCFRVMVKNTFIHASESEDTNLPHARSKSMPPTHRRTSLASPSNGKLRCVSMPGTPTSFSETVATGELTLGQQGFHEEFMGALIKKDEASQSDMMIQDDYNPEDGPLLTVMIKNIPCSCSSEDVLNAVELLGFKELFNFFYLPVKRFKENLGYGFIGFENATVTKQFIKAMTGFRFKASRNSRKIVSVVPARTQGLQQNMEIFKNTRTMNGKWPPIFISNPEDRLAIMAQVYESIEPDGLSTCVEKACNSRRVVRMKF